MLHPGPWRGHRPDCRSSVPTRAPRGCYRQLTRHARPGPPCEGRARRRQEPAASRTLRRRPAGQPPDQHSGPRSAWAPAGDGHPSPFACRRALIEWHPPAWFDQLEPGRTYAGTIGDLRVTSLKDGLLTAVVTYRSGAQSWTHTFAARRLDLAGLRVQMRGAGLILSGPLAGAPQWLHVTSQRRSARRGLYGALGFSQPNPSCDPSALLPPPAHAWSGWRPVEQEVPDGSQPCGARGDLCRCG